MAKYEVELVGFQKISCTVTVEASSMFEAHQIAMDTDNPQSWLSGNTAGWQVSGDGAPQNVTCSDVEEIK